MSTPTMTEKAQQAVDRLSSVGAAHTHIFNPFVYDVVRFAQEQVFDESKISALCDILVPVIQADFASWQRTSAQSIADLQDRMLAHSVARPPASVCVFMPSEAVAVMEFLLRTYYRHFKAYKYAFASVPQLEFRQCLPVDVLAPTVCIARIPPLSRAILVDTIAPATDAQAQVPPAASAK